MAAEAAAKTARSVDSGLIPGAEPMQLVAVHVSHVGTENQPLFQVCKLSVCVHARAGMLLRGFRARGAEEGSVFVMPR